jgi:predicted methyltransferase
VEGSADDPHLPVVGVDVVLVVNAYHEFRHYQAMLEGIFKALKPGGLLGLIDGVASPGSARDSYVRRHRIPEQIVREDALHAGFQFLGERPGFTRPDDGKEYYFLIFEKPGH